MGGSVTARAVDAAWRPAALALVDELEARGLVAWMMGHGAVRVHNPAGEPDADDPQGQVLSPGLGQEVVCRLREGVLWWWWVWSGPTRDAPPELEPLCPAADSVTAADRLARVVAVPFAGAPGSAVSGSAVRVGSSGGCG